MKQILAWHFVGDTLRDGSAIPKDGEWLKVKTPLAPCHHGLHASLNPFDALQYARGATLCRVALRGEIVHGDDKLCASERMIICRMDATELLRYFARMQALSVVHLYNAPDVVLDYLMTGNKDIRAAAWDAAWAAARDAAWAAAAWDAAAWDAARDAARAAAWAAAWAAAAWDAAARDAARAAAWAARDAAWDAAAWDAARDAARAAAWAARDAAWDAAKEEFTAFVHECFGV